jgi:hypothetical protein
MAFNVLIRRSSQLGARALKPLKKGDPEASKPVYINGVRTFPPTIDENGTITYYHEFPEGWKPYSNNYAGHGWLIVSQILLWATVYTYKESTISKKQKY